MSYIVLDFETLDPSIKERGCSGWPYGEVKVLGCALKTDKECWYELNTEKLFEILPKYDTIICHNSQYDCGILHMLGYDIYKHTLIDTKILAKLYKSNLLSTSLDSLAKQFLGKEKELTELLKLAEELKERGLLKYTKAQSPTQKLYENMDVAQEYGFDVIESYALQDTKLTEELYIFFMDSMSDKPIDLTFWSDLLKCLIKSRANGIPIDTQAMEIADQYLQTKITKHLRSAHAIAGEEFNLNSSDSLHYTLKTLGIKIATSETGKYTCTKKLMQEDPHPIFKEILAWRLYTKARKDFILSMHTFIKDGKIYPEFNIMGADTGRFTCKAPNIQQIPARDEETLQLCRAIFAAPVGKKWASLDYSAQEPRLQVHFAALSKCPGADILKKAYIENPNLDLHDKVAKICNIERKEAKTINLGLSYGMGMNKLAISLGVSLNKAKSLKSKYEKSMPYLHYLMTTIDSVLKKRDYIWTLGGRKVYIDQGFSYKGLNYLIQGSAADQTMKALVTCYRNNIDILFSVHDELNLLTDGGDESTIKKVKTIMQKCYTLEVPVVAEVKVGQNWSECK